MKLSAHFTLDEMTRSNTAIERGIRNVPALRETANLQRLAGVLEQVRTALGGHPIIVTSGYRAPLLNAAVGGAKGSAHLTGLAADFTVPAFGTPLAVAQAIQAARIQFDQLIHEYGRWVHLGLADGQGRQQLLTIDSRGTRPGLHQVRS